MPVRALVEAGDCFGMASSAVRVALARLLAEKRVERDERGRYRLGVAAAPVVRTIRNWRRLEAQTVEWSGGWIGVCRRRGKGRGQARRLGDQSLMFLGFREFEPALFLRPDNLTGGVGELRAQLGDLGLEDTAPVFELSGLDPSGEARALALWDEVALGDAYGEAAQMLSESRLALEAAPAREAMVETFRLGGRVIRQLVLDPLLPDAIAPTAGRDALAAQMRDYDVFGRSCWAEFLGRHGVLHRRTPADLRVMKGADPMISVAGALPRMTS